MPLLLHDSIPYYTLAFVLPVARKSRCVKTVQIVAGTHVSGYLEEWRAETSANALLLENSLDIDFQPHFEPLPPSHHLNPQNRFLNPFLTYNPQVLNLLVGVEIWFLWYVHIHEYQPECVKCDGVYCDVCRYRTQHIYARYVT